MTAFYVLLIGAAHLNMSCINIEGVTLDGDYRMVEGASPVPYLQSRLETQPSEHGFIVQEWLRGQRKNGDTVMNRAVLQILNGQYDEAIGALHAIEEERPGLYATASNLGTAYELAGNNREALR